MGIKKLWIFLSLIFLSTNVFGKPSQFIDDFDLRTYNPVRQNLKDLVFEARIENLASFLNEHKAYGEIVDLYFKVYWIFPGQYKIEVNGLPKGFREMKSQLKNILKGQLAYIIPEKLSEKMKDYNFAEEKQKTGKFLLKGIERTNTKAINRINLLFEKNGMLNQIEMFAPNNVVSSKIEQSPKTWSQNKWVVDKIETRQQQGNIISNSEVSFSYKNWKDYGFPDSIGVSTKQSIKGKKGGVENNLKFIFSKYEVNTGKAKRYMLKGQKS